VPDDVWVNEISSNLDLVKHFYLESLIMSEDKSIRKVGALFSSILLAKVPEMDEKLIVKSPEAYERIKSEMLKFIMGT
jgi:hypothetical protein